MRIRLKSLARKIHLYLALGVGFMFFLSGLTGTTLVFYKAIDEIFNPELQVTAPSPNASYQSISQWMESASQVSKEGQQLARIYLPRHEEAYAIVRFFFKDEAGEFGMFDVAVNPYTSEVLAARVWGSYLMTFIYKLHFTLLMGDEGEAALGFLGIILLCVLLSGIYLWWPRRNGFLRALKINTRLTGIGFLASLHKTAGIYAAVVLLVIVSAGVSMVFLAYVRAAVEVVSPITDTRQIRVTIPEGYSQPLLTADEIAVAARALYPDAMLQRVYLPLKPDRPYQVIMRHPGETRKTNGVTRAWLSPMDGAPIYKQDPDSLSGGEVLLAWIYPLHNGEAFGLVGRLIILLAGISVMGLYITGLMMWWRKRPRSS